MTRLVILLLIAAFFNGLSWIVLIPVWQYPDEQAHFAQVQDVAELNYIPNGKNTSREIALSEQILGTKRDGFGNNKFTYHPEYKINYSNNYNGLFEDIFINLPQTSRLELVKNEATQNPPLYYFLGSFAYKLFYNSNLFGRIFTLRIFSLLMFMLTIFLSLKIGSLVFENSSIFRIVLPCLVAFKPMLVFASTGILPDPLTNLLFSLVVFLSVLIIKGGIKVKYLLFAFVVIILGSLDRQQFLISLPILAVAVFYRASRDYRKKSKYFFGILAVVVILILLSFLILQLQRITIFSIPEIGHPNLNLLLSVDFFKYTVQFIKETVRQTLPWYWGVYRWLSFTLPPLYYRIIDRFILIAIAGVVVRLFFMMKRRQIKTEEKVVVFFILASLIYFGLIMIWDYYFRLLYGYSFGIQGRYFFPFAVVHMSILLFGIWQIFEISLKRYAIFGAFALVILIIIFNDISLFYVSSSYYGSRNLEIFIVQASQYKPLLFKGNMILLILSLNLGLQILLLVYIGKYAVKKFSQKYY